MEWNNDQKCTLLTTYMYNRLATIMFTVPYFACACIN